MSGQTPAARPTSAMPAPAARTEEEDSSIAQVSELLDRLVLGSPDDPAEMAYAVLVAGISALEQAGIVTRLKAAAEDMSNPIAREGALKALKSLAEHVGKPAEPFLVPLLPLMLERFGDKAEPVRKAAQAAALALASSLCQHAVPVVLPTIFEAMGLTKQWQVREGALKLLKQFAATAPNQIAAALKDIVPIASECLIDSREQVRAG
jgi:elongation factor 3